MLEIFLGFVMLNHVAVIYHGLRRLRDQKEPSDKKAKVSLKSQRFSVLMIKRLACADMTPKFIVYEARNQILILSNIPCLNNFKDHKFAADKL